MICTMVLTVTVLLPSGKEANMQRHFNQKTLEEFNNQIGSKIEALDLPPGVKLVDVVGIEDVKLFKCGTKPTK
jgi:hypothetical protein